MEEENKCPKIATPAILNEPVSNLNLDSYLVKGKSGLARTSARNRATRIRVLFARAEVQTIGALVTKTEEELLSLRNVGQCTVSTLRYVLERQYGLDLGMIVPQYSKIAREPEK